MGPPEVRKGGLKWTPLKTNEEMLDYWGHQRLERGSKMDPLKNEQKKCNLPISLAWLDYWGLKPNGPSKIKQERIVLVENRPSK